MWMAHLARRSFLSGGRERVDMRGMAPMTLALAAEYGMMTYDPYNCGGDANYNVLARRLTAMARRSHSMARFDSRCTDILDESLGYMPSRFWLYGVEYSPRQLARSLFLPGDYTALTSFTHHPMGDTFALEVPDNKTACRFLNVPVDTLMARICSALKTGHAVCWEGDVTEPGFSFARGTAELPSRTPCARPTWTALLHSQELVGHGQSVRRNDVSLGGICADEDNSRGDARLMNIETITQHKS